jgi:molybdopterin synthase sulfur carrier subunit
MQANLYATFRLIANVKTIPLDLPAGSTAMQAIQAIVQQYPALRSHWLDKKGELHAHVHVFINGHDIALMPEGVETHLKAEDMLDFFPPVAGG